MARYRIDPAASRFTARAFAGGPLSAVGHNPSFALREFGGEVEYDPEPPGSGSLRLTVAAQSLVLTDSVSDKDRRDIERTLRDDVLESARFSEITYVCPASRATPNGQAQITLNGDLTLHGVTRAQPVPVRVFLTGDVLRGQGEVTLRQGDFDIRLVSVAGGMLKVKDEVKITFDIVARRV